MSMTVPDSTSDEDRYTRDEMVRLAAVLIASLVVACIAAVAATSHDPNTRAYGLIVLTGVLGLAGGALLGFLFGLPKTAPRPLGPPPGGGASTAGAPPAPAPVPSRFLNTNTNLEELSDWLTKIIVGLGLIQLGKVNGYLLAFEDAIRAVNTGGPPLAPLCAALMLCLCLIAGFLWMYLEARTVLSRVFSGVEKSLSLNDTLTRALSQIANAGSVSNTAMGPAADALKTAVSLNPTDPRLRVAAVKALTGSGRAGEAASILERGGPPAGVDEQISNMLVQLYRPPEGYKTVISTAQALVGTNAVNRADYWFYLAAALGQKYSVLRAQNPQDQAEMSTTADSLFDAARRAIAIAPTYRVRLLTLARPAPGSPDDDLKAFADDHPDFLTLLEPSTT